MQNELSPDKQWRDFKMNMCRAGSMHLKALRFRTTLPPEATQHMELICDHDEPHVPCAGRDNNGVSRTRASVAYTSSLWHMLMVVAALVAGVAVTTDPSSYDNELHDSFFTTLLEDIPDADYGGGGCVDVSTPFHEWVGGVWQVEDAEEFFLARRKLEIYWDRVKNLPPEVPSTHKDVSIHSRVPILVRKRAEKAVKKHKRIFDTTAETGMPLACHGEPVKIELKPDAKP